MAKIKNENVNEETVTNEPAQEVQTLTIARALNEIKLINKKIEKVSNTNSFVTYRKGKLGVPLVKDTSEFANVANSLKSLIERRAAIKHAIAIANTQTKIKAGAYELSITAALALKETLVYQENLLAGIKYNLANTRKSVEKGNNSAENDLQDLLKTHFGRDKRSGENDIDMITKQFLESNQYEIINEEIISDNIQRYEEFIETFKNEIDFALSEANATVKIAIP